MKLCHRLIAVLLAAAAATTSVRADEATARPPAGTRVLLFLETPDKQRIEVHGLLQQDGTVSLDAVADDNTSGASARTAVHRKPKRPFSRAHLRQPLGSPRVPFSRSDHASFYALPIAPDLPLEFSGCSN